MLSAGGGARVGWWPLLVTTFITSATPSPSSTIVGLTSIFIVSFSSNIANDVAIILAKLMVAVKQQLNYS